jgi:protein-S-isoprenylcysteine O-methyltransferase Ste14
VFGIYYLRTRGFPDKVNRSDSQLLGFERTTVLVTSGIYHYIRHPLYSSLIFLNWGVFFKQPSLQGVLLAITASLFLSLTAKADESECLMTFGKEYQDYMNITKRFIPLIY